MMGWACNTHGIHEKCMQNLVGKSGKKNHLEVLSIDGRIILRQILAK
jgi:hypothetical protein